MPTAARKPQAAKKAEETAPVVAETPEKITDARVNDPTDLSPYDRRFAKRQEVYSKLNGGAIDGVPIEGRKYIWRPRKGRITKAQLNTNAPQPQYGQKVANDVKHDEGEMTLTRAQTRQIVAFGREHDLTVNDSVFAVLESSGRIPPVAHEMSKIANVYRWEGANEDASGVAPGESESSVPEMDLDEGVQMGRDTRKLADRVAPLSG